MNTLTKKELLNVLVQNGDLPYKKEVIENTFASLPSNLAKGTAWRMYLKYYHSGPVYAMESVAMPGARNYFTSVSSMHKFMQNTSQPDASIGYIDACVKGTRDQIYGYRFYEIRKEEI
jgi:hypothetical protein